MFKDRSVAHVGVLLAQPYLYVLGSSVERIPSVPLGHHNLHLIFILRVVCRTLFTSFPLFLRALIAAVLLIISTLFLSSRAPFYA